MGIPVGNTPGACCACWPTACLVQQHISAAGCWGNVCSVGLSTVCLRLQALNAHAMGMACSAHIPASRRLLSSTSASLAPAMRRSADGDHR